MCLYYVSISLNICFTRIILFLRASPKNFKIHTSPETCDTQSPSCQHTSFESKNRKLR